MSLLTRTIFIVGYFSGLCACQEFMEFKELVKYLNRLHNYETITMFLCESMFQNVNSLFPLIPAQEDDSLKPILLITQKTSNLQSIRTILNGNPLSIVVSDNQNNEIMEVVKETLRGIRHNPIIFYFYLLPNTSIIENEMLIFCDWVEYYQFPNSLVMFGGSSQRYGCDWYPVVKVINQSSWKYTHLLRKSGTGVKLDLRGKVMTMPIAEEKPRIFTTAYNEVSGEMSLSGLSWKIFEAFIEFNNGRIAPYPLYKQGNGSYKSIYDITRLIENRTIQISPNGYANINLSMFAASYPMQTVDYCVMVPVISMIPSYMYLVTPFQENVQIALIAVVIASSLMIFCISEFKSLSLAFLNSISGLLNSNFTGEISEAFVVTSRYFQMLMRVYGFVFTNYYNCLLASFLATTIYGEQINTFQQIVDAHVTPLFLQEDFDYVKPLDVPQSFIDSIVIESAKIVSANRLSLNASFAYLLTSDKWEFHDLQQYYMEKPIMRFSRICVGQFFVSIPLHHDSLFREPLDYFIMKCLSSGLIAYWKTLSFRDLLRISDIHTNVNFAEALPMDIRFFRIAWEFIGLGLSCSLVVFCMEHLYVAFKRKVSLNGGLKNNDLP